MATTFLKTKLNIPPVRPGLVTRPRLTERLNEGANHKLTLISAPAGFGKTTLVSTWFQQQRPHASWLSLDANDNDLARFLTHLIAALEGIDETLGGNILRMVQAPQTPPVETLLTMLVNEIDAIGTEFTLALDDYHLITTPAIHEAITFLLEHQPPTMRLVLIGRADPPLHLSRLRVQGQMTEIRSNDLRFTREEIAAFLNDLMGLDLSPKDITALEARTEGWIASLQLAALSMRGRDDKQTFVAAFSGSHHYIIDYLVDEVMERQPEEIQSFLCRTSVLDRFCAPLCDTVLEIKTSRKILRQLGDAALFLIPLDDERHWFRYHHLFSDFLGQRLRETEPERIPELHRRASDWFARQGLGREALRHTLLAEDYPRAADLIETLALGCLHKGEHTTVSDWISDLPDSLVRERPYLCVYHAWALKLAGQFDAAETHLVTAEEALKKVRDVKKVKTIRGYIHAHRAYLTFIEGAHENTIIHANQALEQLPPQATAIRTQTALYLGAVYRVQGKYQAAEEILSKAMDISRKMGGSYITVFNYVNLAGLYFEQGRLNQAMSTHEQALQLTERHTGRRDMPFTGYCYVGIGRILRQRNDLENAYQHTSKGVVLCREWGTAEVIALSHIELACIQQALGLADEAQKALLEAKEIFEGFSPWGAGVVAAHQARFHLARGFVKAAERWTKASDLNVDGELALHREIEYLTLARVLIAQKQLERALSLLGRLYQIDQASGRIGSVLEILTLQALALSAQGHAEQALTKLEQALTIGEPENYVRIFVDEGEPVAKLLREAVSHAVSPAYAGKLLAAFDSGAKDDRRKTSAFHTSSILPPASSLVDPLSERELEVLRLLATELSGPEIARELMVSANTMRTHTRNIYSKLDVHNRRAAVRRAEELDLL